MVTWSVGWSAKAAHFKPIDGRSTRSGVFRSARSLSPSDGMRPSFSRDAKVVIAPKSARGRARAPFRQPNPFGRTATQLVMTQQHAFSFSAFIDAGFASQSTNLGRAKSRRVRRAVNGSNNARKARSKRRWIISSFYG